MKNLYLVLAIIGFLAPNILVFIESIETGNVLLYAQMGRTMEQMFANRISTIFSIDLLAVTFFFFIWSFRETKKLAMKMPIAVWICTMLFGLAFGFPLFLYLRERKG